MKQMKSTLTIAIPAYNEEGNIANLLDSLLTQKLPNFNLREISVYTDASTDMTPMIVEYKYRKYNFIKLYKGQRRRGKYFRVNQIFNNCKTDYLIILDADIGLKGNLFLEKLLKPLVTDPNAKMVAARNTLLSPSDFMGKIIYAGLMLWDYMRLSLPDLNNGLNYFGSGTAYRGTFARSIKIPENLTDPHFFIYLKAKKTNGFRYCHNAQVFMWSISTLCDYQKLLRRSIGKRDAKLIKIFGNNIYNEYIIPFEYKIVGLIKALKAQPIYTILALLLQIYIIKFSKIKKPNRTPVWEINISTKKPVAYERQ